MRHQGLSRGLSSWVSVWRERQRRLGTMRQGVGRLLHRELSMAWVCWESVAAARASALAIMRRGALRMLNRKLAGAFLSLVERHRQVGQARRALMRLVHRELSRGLSGLVAGCAARRRSPALAPNDGFGLSRPRSVNRGGTSKKSLACRHGALGCRPERVTTPPQAKQAAVHGYF